MVRNLLTAKRKFLVTASVRCTGLLESYCHEQATWCQKPEGFSLHCLREEGAEPMKTLRMTLAVAGLLLAGSLFAQQGVQAKVPFSFYVGNSQLMPSGTYRIAPCSTHLATFRHCESGVTIFHMTRPNDKKVQEQGKLVFHKYGDKYFLKEVQGPSLPSNLAIPESKNEKAARDKMATVTTYETITIPKPEETKPPNQ